MTLEALLIWAIVGGLSGGFVGVVIKGYGIGPLGNVIVGVIGAFLGGWLSGMVGISIGPGIVNTIVSGLIGASASLLSLSIIKRRGNASPAVSVPWSASPTPTARSPTSSYDPTAPTVQAPPLAPAARSPQPTPSHQPADVFISYKREERARVDLIAAALRDLNLSVWFDARLTSGHQFDEEINREVRAAKAVLVCWSKASVQSDWVRAEASIGRQRGVLVACFLEQCDPYPPFNLTHAEDMSFGALDDTNPAWVKIVQRLTQLAGREAAT